MIIEDPLVLWAIVGSVAGIIFALAGTGGGVISIPILMTLGSFDIKDASAYALLPISVGAWISWFMQRKNTDFSTTGVLIFCAALIAFITAPLKEMSPPWLICLILNFACLFSLYSLWILQSPKNRKFVASSRRSLKTVSFGGALGGFINTMTGLGGGVIMIPWLTGVSRLKFEQAMACSLLTVAIISPVAAWRQDHLDLSIPQWMSLIGGVLLTALLVKRFTVNKEPERLLLTRKLCLTFVILLSMARTLALLF